MNERYVSALTQRFINLTSTLKGNVSRQDVLEHAEMLEEAYGNDLKKISAPGGTLGIIYRLSCVIGLKRAINLLYSYLKIKGVITG